MAGRRLLRYSLDLPTMPSTRRRTIVYRFFESLLHPYPPAEPVAPPTGFFGFLWACTQGVRGKIAGDGAADGRPSPLSRRCCSPCSAASSTGSAASRAVPGCGRSAARALTWLACALVASIGVVALQTIVKHQTLAINLPMRLRWNFHRLMLGQSMAFYQDEFAGRITAKVMQTALAVRDTHLRAGRRAGGDGGLRRHHHRAGRRASTAS